MRDEQGESRYAAAEVALAEYLEVLDGGEDASFDEWCAERPEIASELRRLHEEYLELEGAMQNTPPSGGEGSSRRKPADGSPDHGDEASAASDRSRPADDSAFCAEMLGRLGEPRSAANAYTVGPRIARGGMGEVIAVRDTVLHRELAMKVIRREASTADASRPDTRRLARFLEEAQVMAQLDHPGVVPVHELGLDAQGQPYFTMKRVRGRTLSEVFELVRTGQEGWSVTRALGVLQRVCEAMAYAHEQGVTHRDLKPANVMVGHFGEVYVMDWGLARVAGRGDAATSGQGGVEDAGEGCEGEAEESGSTDHAEMKLGGRLHTERSERRSETPDSSVYTRSGQALGTPQYMPPEQAEGRWQDVGPQSDVYAIGAMLYQLLAGRAPYLTHGERPSAEELQRRVIVGAPEPLHRLASKMPAELLAICEKAMARDPGRRYADMAQLGAELAAYHEGRVVQAYETGAWAEARKWVQRNRPLAASLAAAVLLLVAGLTASLLFKARAEENALLASRRADETAEQARIANANEARASEKEREATQKANDVLSLSAIQDLKDLEGRVDELWPAYPENLASYAKWLADARELIEGRSADPSKGIKARASLAQHQAKLAELRLRAKALTAEELEADRRASPSLADWDKARAKLQWMRRMLGEEAWPLEPEVEAALAKEMLPADANALNEQAWPLVDTDPAKVVYGSEVRGLLLARRAVAAASDKERAGIRDTLAWANFRVGRFEQAVAEETQALGEAEEATKAEFEGDVVKLAGAIALWRGEERAKRSQEALELAALATELERGSGERRTFEFEDAGDRWWHAQLSKLVSDLKAFTDEKSGGPFSSGISERHGWGIVKRAEFARMVAERSVSGADAKLRWDEAIAAISRSPKYGGLVMTPQIGLLPIGEDPESLLWEFAHLQTGDPPERGADGKLMPNESMGLVFVLIPAGTFWMGAQKTDPHSRNHDTQAGGDESPVHEVTVSPYFLSKYEMTQGQWERFAGKDPSLYRKESYSSGWNRAGKSGSALHPVEQVTWTDCMEVLGRLGCDLPTEAQWENGCRGGTSSVFWSGDGLVGFGEVANISDAYAREHGAAWTEYQLDVDDGNTAHAEVGSYRANAYGLHDVHGNLWEWCRDGYAEYTAGKQVDPVTPGIGASDRVIRGGGFTIAASSARSARRNRRSPEYRYIVLGLRPARAFQLAAPQPHPQQR